MKTKTLIIVVGLMGLAMFTASLVLGASMEGELATHWNAAGEADGFGSRLAGLYLLPMISIGTAVLLIFLPSIDPLKANITAFRGEYNLFVLFFTVFLFYLHGLTLAWNLGVIFSMNGMLMPAIGLFFILTGRMIGKAKRNYFIGIRTPWTLANDIVWEKTHKLGSRLFVISGALTIATIIYPSAAMWVLLTTA
jgi:uncharacterized membrane protein